MSRPTDGRMSRREFVRGGVVAGGLALTGPLILPSSALGAEKRAAAGERIVVGAIGLGGRGQYVLGAFLGQPDVQVVAVCDVQGDRRAAGKAAVDKHYGNHDCVACIDLAEILARPDIDAVMIATGDNWHALASCMAARAGKDIYCEKPLSITIGESRAVADTVKRFARVFQCGTQRRNVGNFVFAVQLARSGRLGKLRNVQAEKAGATSGVNFRVLPPQPEPAREAMDWNQWLGPAPWRPYNAEYHSRGFWAGHGDFSGGPITEWGSHTVDQCQWAANADHTGPLRYRVTNDRGDVEAEYASGVKLVIRSGLRFGSCPVRFEGDEGWVETGDSGHVETHPASLLQDRKFLGGYPAENHVREFLDCVKSRRQPSSTAETSHRSISACHVANICVRLGRPVQWDPVREEFVNDEEANRLRSRPCRQPWRL